MVSGFTGHSAGWAVNEYADEGKRWHWWARFDTTVTHGEEPTWAQAVGAAKKAFTELEKNSPEPNKDQ